MNTHIHKTAVRPHTRQLVTAALCAAMGLLLPSVFHLFGGAGPAFLPMHIPILLCGLLCGWQYGALCGIVVPLLSSAMTGMPVLYPTGVAMCFELACYGAVSGFLYRRWGVYPSLICAMLAGRAVSGCANAILLGLGGKTYALSAFLSTAFVVAVPGIIIQLIVLPAIVKLLERAGYQSAHR